MSKSSMTHHDIDHVERLIEHYRDENVSPDERHGWAIQIVDQIRMEEWCSELRRLRERCGDDLY